VAFFETSDIPSSASKLRGERHHDWLSQRDSLDQWSDEWWDGLQIQRPDSLVENQAVKLHHQDGWKQVVDLSSTTSLHKFLTASMVLINQQLTSPDADRHPSCHTSASSWAIYPAPEVIETCPTILQPFELI
jgi:hypothetical protein